MSLIRAANLTQSIRQIFKNKLNLKPRSWPIFLADFAAIKLLPNLKPARLTFHMCRIMPKFSHRKIFGLFFDRLYLRKASLNLNEIYRQQGGEFGRRRKNLKAKTDKKFILGKRLLIYCVKFCRTELSALLR